MARDFAAEKIAPHAIPLDGGEAFPVDVMRRGGQARIGGVYIRLSAVALKPVRCGADLRGPGQGCPTVSAFISSTTGVLDDRLRNDTSGRKCYRSSAPWSYGELLPDRAGLGSDAAALRTRAVRDGDHYCSTARSSFHFPAPAKGDIYVVMGANRRRRPWRISTLVIEHTPGLSPRATSAKMGWNAQRPGGDFSENGGPRAPLQPAGDEDRLKIAMAGSTADAFNIGPVRSAARNPRSTIAGLYERAQGFWKNGSTNSRRCNSGLPTWRRAGAARDFVWARGGGSTRKDADARCYARWPSASVPTSFPRSLSRAGNCTAVRLSQRYGIEKIVPRSARAPDSRRHQRDHAG